MVIGDPAGSKIFRISTLEFQNYSRVSQHLCLFSGLSRPGNLNILISGLSKVCMNSGFSTESDELTATLPPKNQPQAARCIGIHDHCSDAVIGAARRNFHRKDFVRVGDFRDRLCITQGVAKTSDVRPQKNNLTNDGTLTEVSNIHIGFI